MWLSSIGVANALINTKYDFNGSYLKCRKSYIDIKFFVMVYIGKLKYLKEIII